MDTNKKMIEGSVEWFIRRKVSSLTRNPKIDFIRKDIFPEKFNSLILESLREDKPKKKDWDKYLCFRVYFSFDLYDNGKMINSEIEKPFVSGVFILTKPSANKDIFSVSLTLENITLVNQNSFLYCTNSILPNFKGPLFKELRVERILFIDFINEIISINKEALK